jgi:hypothetical protein
MPTVEKRLEIDRTAPAHAAAGTRDQMAVQIEETSRFGRVRPGARLTAHWRPFGPEETEALPLVDLQVEIDGGTGGPYFW